MGDKLCSPTKRDKDIKVDVDRPSSPRWLPRPSRRRMIMESEIIDLTLDDDLNLCPTSNIISKSRQESSHRSTPKRHASEAGPDNRSSKKGINSEYTKRKNGSNLSLSPSGQPKKRSKSHHMKEASTTTASAPSSKPAPPSSRSFEDRNTGYRPGQEKTTTVRLPSGKSNKQASSGNVRDSPAASDEDDPRLQKNQVDQARSTIHELQLRVQQLDEIKSNQSDRVQTLESAVLEHERLTSERHREINEAQMAKATVEANLELIRSEKASLEHEALQLTETKECLGKQLSAARELIEEQKSQLIDTREMLKVSQKGSEASGSLLRQEQDARQNAQAQLALDKQELAHAQKQVSDLKEESKKKQIEARELLQANNELMKKKRNTDVQVEDLTIANTNLKNDLEQFKSRLEKDTKGELEVKAQLGKTRQALRECQEEANMLNARCSDLQVNQTSLKTERDKLQQTVADREAQHKQVTSQLTDLIQTVREQHSHMDLCPFSRDPDFVKNEWLKIKRDIDEGLALSENLLGPKPNTLA